MVGIVAMAMMLKGVEGEAELRVGYGLARETCREFPLVRYNLSSSI